MILYRPIAQCDPARPDHALTLAGGWCWFTHAEVLVKGGSEGPIPAADIPADVRDRLMESFDRIRREESGWHLT